jgi:hypothetical protein
MHASASVTIYQHNDYQGTSKQFPPGRFDMNALGVGNDQLSSLKVPPGFRVTLYEHSGFQGRTKQFTADAPSVGDFNDLTSSMVVEVVEDMITLGEGENFQGVRKDLKCVEGVIKGTAIGLKQITSLSVPNGWTVIVRDEDGEWGNYKLALSAKGKEAQISSIAPIPVTPQLLVVISKVEA